jgi:hypothetical protein
MTTNANIVVITQEALMSMVKTAVSEALAEKSQEVAPELLDRISAARALRVGTSTLDRLRREGLPCIMIGESPRFERAACIAWLRQHHGQPTDTAADTADVPAGKHPDFYRLKPTASRL